MEKDTRAVSIRATVNPVREAYDRLLGHFGPQYWWPAWTPFEVIVGAVLMPQTAWRNVAAAIENLRRAGLLSPSAIAATPVAELRRLVRVAGLYRAKPRRLKALCAHLSRAAGGDLERWLASRDTAELRDELLLQEGIGPETADSILLYAVGRPVFVVDAYTRRIGQRLGWFATGAYAEVQRFFEAALPSDARLFNEYHALLVRHAKELCRPRPLCPECPLNGMCSYYRATRSSGAPALGRQHGD